MVLKDESVIDASRRRITDEYNQLLSFRVLLEGLHWTRAYITEAPSPRPEFRLA